MSWGDPWEEFNRLTWTVQRSPIFASAMLRSYFGGNVPTEFWQLMALYVASNQLSCIAWAIPFGQEEIDVMIHQNREVRAWYKGTYGDGAPEWYTQIPVQYGSVQDIDAWMALVRAIAWNFPGLETEKAILDHEQTVLRFMGKKQALCVKDGDRVIGVLLFSRNHNMICCLGVDPLYRRRGIASALLTAALAELDRTRPITVSTFRENDKKGTAPRALYKKYGFVEDALTIEFDYPNQVFILPPTVRPNTIHN